MESYFQDKTYDKCEQLTIGEYENCIFKNCHLAEQKLKDYKFIDCTFLSCNLSLADIGKTIFNNAKFQDCKMLGLRFDTCNKFGLALTFDSCILNHSSFYNTKLKKTIFKNSQLQEIDFTEADLSEAIFESCDLLDTNFDHTILEKADFSTAYNYTLDPEVNRIKKAKFSIHGIAGLLAKYDIQIENII